jgi:hypothetical protein
MGIGVAWGAGEQIEGTPFRVVVPGSDASGHAVVLTVDMPPGLHVDAHIHDTEEQINIVLSGHVRFRVGTEENAALVGLGSAKRDPIGVECGRRGIRLGSAPRAGRRRWPARRARGLAGEYFVTVLGQEDHGSIDHVVEARCCQQHPDVATSALVDWADINGGQEAGKVRLTTVSTSPHLVRRRPRCSGAPGRRAVPA